MVSFKVFLKVFARDYNFCFSRYFGSQIKAIISFIFSGETHLYFVVDEAFEDTNKTQVMSEELVKECHSQAIFYFSYFCRRFSTLPCKLIRKFPFPLVHMGRFALFGILYYLKNVKNTHGGVLLLVRLYKYTFFKLYKSYQIAQSIINVSFHMLFIHFCEFGVGDQQIRFIRFVLAIKLFCTVSISAFRLSEPIS